MLNWLWPQYDIYLVYQKYPGNLYEYPALKFAQWILQTSNKTLLLYLHTKGASHSISFQKLVRKLWKNEFTYPRNKIYIKFLLNNDTDITIPFRKDKCTWYNGMFISKRAFDLIHEVSINKRRHFYEGGIFGAGSIRIKGIISDNQSPSEIGNEVKKYLKLTKYIYIKAIIQEIILLLFIIIFKLYINNSFKIIKYKIRKNFISKIYI